MSKKIFCSLLILGMAYFTFQGFLSWRQGYSWEEMDWAQKSRTTIMDFLAASDIGKREILKSGNKCVEYFAYKDGMPIKTVCPE